MVGSLVLGRNGSGQNGHEKGIEGSMSSALWNQEDSGGEKGREVEGRPVAKSRFSVSCTQPHGKSTLFSSHVLNCCAWCLRHGRDGNSPHPPPHPHPALKLEYGNCSCAWDVLGQSPVCARPYFSSRERAHNLFPPRLSPLSRSPSLAQASWRRCYESKRLEKAQAATGLHLKGPRCLRTPP